MPSKVAGSAGYFGSAVMEDAIVRLENIGDDRDDPVDIWVALQVAGEVALKPSNIRLIDLASFSVIPAYIAGNPKDDSSLIQRKIAAHRPQVLVHLGVLPVQRGARLAVADL